MADYPLRWKWFWDGWPGNVTETGATTPPKAEDEMYDIFSFKVKLGIFVQGARNEREETCVRR